MNIRIDTRGYDESEFSGMSVKEYTESLGMTYTHLTSHPIGDITILWGCNNVPETLPYFAKMFNSNPYDFVGFGLTKEMADKLSELQRGTDENN